MGLKGKRVVITRPLEQSGELRALLEGAGGIPILFPTLATEAIPLSTSQHFRHHTYDWLLFTSANGVRYGLEYLAASGLALAPSTRIGVVGAATAAALEPYGLKADLIAQKSSAEGLLEALRARGPLAGQRFLLLVAEEARGELFEGLKAERAFVERIPVYRTVLGHPNPEALAALREGFDAAVFASPSSVRGWVALAPGIVPPKVVCIGPTTAQAARECGLGVDCVADAQSAAGLLEALEKVFTEVA
ncbi:uroporphyrinogen-III synthase [Calidithermus roseus]|uniref:Uroporphyrinogen-III synthase n=1 Tax=Calidithermus roseus TaxID=1644118 RepID=A0A399EUR2_9DEIN|nr:uroporphyrinogen-III synthase [Calidithermus roseus]RIH88357.1 Uroporphyrinogen-III synthase [Calidithermus roseus]